MALRAAKVPRPRPSEPPPRSAKKARTVEISRTGAVVYVSIVAVLVLLLWSVNHERESHVRVPDLKSLEEALPSIAGLTGSPVFPGNRVEILQNGDEFFPSLLRDIAAARETIHMETYVWWKGEICERVGDALAAKARQGVEVRLLLDAVGANKGDEKLFGRMQDTGVKIARYHPFSPGDIGLFNNRTHRKLAVFDGRVAYVFGHGIAEEWTGHAQDKDHWRDTGLRVQGPVVGAVQAVFSENWMEETAEVLVGERFFPPLQPAGPVRAQMVASSPQGGVSRQELLFKLVIATAQKELLIQNPYFIPDGEVDGLIDKAVRRGVDVRLMLPGAVTDSSIVRHAGHRWYEDLLNHGVRIFEYLPTLNHQKILIVDGLWSHVGSANFDDRSLDINDEASVGMIDPEVAGRLRQAFFADLKSCREVKLAEWRKRSAWHHLIDRFSYSINEQL
ncbi:MAG TPA: phospholipase D-like domain-containing protein [Thermoanaerobaculia bacterium]|nr:phospholipase D-like domain-containing protein [Thermoanaerobaculia bacterium]